MSGMERLLSAAMHGHPTAMAICALWVDMYGALPDCSTDTNEQANTFVIGPFITFPPK